MYFHFLLFLAACSSSTTDKHLDSEDSTDSGLPFHVPDVRSVSDSDTGGIPSDTGIDSPCIFGFVEIEGSYCISAYENRISVAGSALSEPGVLPTWGVTYTEVSEICSRQGMHLATFEEWRDAGDGVIGEGGTRFPWGDESDAYSRCAAPDETGAPVLTEPVETGQYPDCVSPSGIYDQIGNVWEWVNSGQMTDSTTWVANRMASGVTVTLDSGGIQMDTLGTTPWSLQMVGLAIGEDRMSLDSSGYLVVESDSDINFSDARFITGYLLQGSPDSGENYLPVRLIEIAGEPNFARLGFVSDLDNAPLPGKVGGAYYSGAGMDLQTMFLGHTPDFDGTIGFRCAY